jgi:uncharacterized protein YfaS (alpha-2-macroglobulin family)
MRLKAVFSIFAVSFFISLIAGSYLTYLQNKPESLSDSSTTSAPIQVLGITGGGGSRSNRQPQMYVYGGENAFGSGGVVSMSSSDEPSLTLSAYNVSGTAEVTLYPATMDMVLNYLVHDTENKQINKSVDTSGVTPLASTTHTIQSSNESTVLPLPLEGKGVWYVTIKLSNITVDGFIIRSDHGVVAKEGNSKFAFWAQNFATGKSVDGGEIKLYNLKDNIKQITSANLKGDGTGETDMSAEADLALYVKGDDTTLLPLNLQYLNVGSGYTQFAKTLARSRYFIFTDRPLYQPGDTVNFKAIIRSDDDARYSVPEGNAKVTISTGNNETKFEKSYPISADGSINGKYELPDNAPVGGYNLTVDLGQKPDYTWMEYSSNSLYFNVEHYQKPESFLEVDTPQLEYISGDTAKVQISGSYFSGQPLLATEVKYRITAVDYYEYSYFSDQELSSRQTIDSFYGTWYGSEVVKEGVVTLDKNGLATIDVDTRQIEPSTEYSNYTKGQSKVFVVEVTQNDASQTPSFSKKNFLVYAGEYGIYQTSNNSSGKVNQSYKLPLKLSSYFRQVDLSGLSLTGKIHRETWVKDDVQNQKYLTYHKEEEDLGEVKLTTAKDATTNLSFTPTKVGFYQIKVEGHDKLGNYIAKNFSVYISDRDLPLYRGMDAPEISVTLDKDKYLPTDSVKATIVSAIPDRDVYLTLERGRLDRAQVIHLSGKSKEVEIPLIASDVPNMYLTLSSFNNYTLDVAEVNVPVSAAGKKLIVTIDPDSTKYGPGDNVSVDLSTTDQDGTPQSAEVALWAVDKAIFELADTNLFNIFDSFWAERGDTTYESHSLQGILTQQVEGGGGCFVAGTAITMSNGSTRPIETIKAGDKIMTRSSDNSRSVKAKVLSIHQAESNGYLIINDVLRVTPEHILRVDGKWRTAGDLQIGDTLTNESGQPVAVESIAWQLGKFTVYNLEVETYHTFIADGYWVHNQKGDGRTNFKDTAYWNPVIKTGSNGKASVKFKLPDNLTTWTMAAVASTKDSRVGQDTKEIVVTKDLIIRPILPNIMRVGDEIYISALVQNFTDTSHQFTAQLSFDAGQVVENTWEHVQIGGMAMEQLDWKVVPNKVTGNAKLKITASAEGLSTLSDEIEIEIPVRQFGFLEKRGETGIGDITYTTDLNSEIDKDLSNVKLSLASSLFGTLPSVMNYLVDYAYGCVEQTVSRLVPSIIVAENPSLYGADLKDENLDKVVDKNLTRLQTMQRGDGGWTWWFTGKSDPFITTYVVGYLQRANSLGYEIRGNMLERADNYLKQHQPDFAKTKLEELDPDELAIVVMNNYKRGDKNPSTNGLKRLSSLAIAQGDGVYWEAGSKARFGSIEASTGLALQALVESGGDRELADKAVLYLTRARKSDYWGNTYATARIVEALTGYAKLSRDLDPDYTYEVSRDGKKVTSGSIVNPLSLIGDVDFAASDLKDSGSQIQVTKSGEGNLYTTLVTSQFLTSKSQPSLNRGISISKRFENTKGADLPIGVGDTVNVMLTISGLSSEDKYGVITDELPSGMVPVNTDLKNEQTSWNVPEDYETGYNITNTEVTENGVILALYNVPSETRTYTYKARVVSAGKFAVPPATIALMYSPEIYGRSATSQIELSKVGGASTGQLTNKLIWPIKLIVLAAIVALAVIAITILVLKKRRQKLITPQPDSTLPPTQPLPPHEV